MNPEKPKSPWAVEEGTPFADKIAKEEQMKNEQENWVDRVKDKLNDANIKMEVIPYPDPDERIAFKILEGIPSKFRTIFEEEVERFNNEARKNNIPHYTKISGDEYVVVIEVIEGRVPDN